MNNLYIIPSNRSDIDIILNKDISGLIVGIKNLSIYNYEIDIDDIINIASNSDKKIIVGINKMIHNSDIPLVKEVLSKIKNSNIYGILFYDVGIIKLAKDIDIDKNLIIGQEHLNASSYSNIFYYNEGVHSTFISSDITKDEIINIKNNTKMNIFYTVYGLLPIFYSRRLLLSSYFDYIKQNREDNKYYIYNNGNKYTIIQRKYGTIIYSPLVNLINHIDELKDINLVIDLSLEGDISIIDSFIHHDKINRPYIGFYNTKTSYKVKGDKNA